MKEFDVTVIGGGMVGLSLIASLADSPLRIALLEPTPPHIPASETTFRVSALNFASQQWLNDLGVWQTLANGRTGVYHKMSVWEKDSFGKIEFDTVALNTPQLGHIVENHLIQHALWEKVMTMPNVTLFTERATGFEVSEHNAILPLADGEILLSKLVVGADGANSWLRSRANIPLISRDYGHHALVCNVETEEPHAYTAHQVFAPDSILAFLPMQNPHHCSIVWSLPPEKAKALCDTDETTFNRQLCTAFDNRLGLCNVQTQRAIFPLTARYARDFAQPRCVLIGDAAHTIHPLAGLGVNLGFQDAKDLGRNILQNFNAQLDIGNYRHLRQFERQRKLEAVKMLTAMQGLRDLFHGEQPVKKLIRDIGLSATNRLAPLKTALMRQAMGL